MALLDHIRGSWGGGDDGETKVGVETTIANPHQPTLDNLWEEGSSIGRVTIETDYKGVIEAKIKFDTPGGSTVWAKGGGSTPHDCLKNAIKEAKRIIG